MKKVRTKKIKEALELTVPGNSIEGINYIYNNLKDPSDGLFFNAKKTGKVGKVSDFDCKSKINYVDYIVLYPNNTTNPTVSLTIPTLKQWKELVSYVESRIKTIDDLNKQRIKDKKPIINNVVITHPSRDLSITIDDYKKV